MMKLSEEQHQVLKSLIATFAIQRVKTFFFLALALFVSALIVVSVKNIYRQRFIVLQQAYSQQNQLETEWAQLLLEENTFAAHTRVEGVASGSLNMISPTAKDVQLIQLPPRADTLLQPQAVEAS